MKMNEDGPNLDDLNFDFKEEDPNEDLSPKLKSVEQKKIEDDLWIQNLSNLRCANSTSCTTTGLQDHLDWNELHNALQISLENDS